MGASQMLAPQRKDLDAAFAATQGIRTPKVFSSFDDARNFVLCKDGELIIRTEHPLEREGLSGLNFSHKVSLKDVEHDEKHGGLFASFREFTPEVLNYLMQDWHKRQGSARYYCSERGLDLDAYLADLTHSYWEYVSGHNLYVVADPVVYGRYRVFAGWRGVVNDRPRLLTSYDIFDGSIKITKGNTPAEVLAEIENIQRLYNKTREIFGQEMCWVVEMQLGKDGQLYFLQRSVGKPFEPCGWTFDSDEPCHFLAGPKYGYGEVRGATPKEGIEVNVLLERGTRLNWWKGCKPSAMLDSHIDCLVVEQKSLESVGVFIQAHKQYHADGARDPHSFILPLVRAPLYLYLPDLHERFPPDIRDEIARVEMAKRNGVRTWYSDPKYMAQVMLHIRSDGNEARVNILKVI